MAVAEYVAVTSSTSKITHKIAGDGEWSYVRDNFTGCGRKASGVEHRQSGKPVEITCRAAGCR